MPATIDLAHAGGTTGEWAGAAARGVRRVPGAHRRRRPPPAHGGTTADLRPVAERVKAMAGGPPRILVAKPGLDGHSNGAEQIAVAARDAGMEVIYQGIRLTPEQIAAVARDEDVDVVGLSILSGRHLELVPEVVRRLRDAGVDAPVDRRRHHPRGRPAAAARRRASPPSTRRRTSSSAGSWPRSPTSWNPTGPEYASGTEDGGWDQRWRWWRWSWRSPRSSSPSCADRGAAGPPSSRADDAEARMHAAQAEHGALTVTVEELERRRDAEAAPPPTPVAEPAAHRPDDRPPRRAVLRRHPQQPGGRRPPPPPPGGRGAARGRRVRRRRPPIRRSSPPTCPDTVREADIACRLDGDRCFGMVLEDTPENGAVWTVERFRRSLAAGGEHAGPAGRDRLLPGPRLRRRRAARAGVRRPRRGPPVAPGPHRGGDGDRGLTPHERSAEASAELGLAVAPVVATGILAAAGEGRRPRPRSRPASRRRGRRRRPCRRPRTPRRRRRSRRATCPRERRRVAADLELVAVVLEGLWSTVSPSVERRDADRLPVVGLVPASPRSG